MANFERSYGCMISAVVYMPLRWVWHFCNLPCVSVLFWLISLATHVFKSASICSWGTRFDVFYERVAYFVLWLRARLWLEMFAFELFHQRPHGFTSRKLYACLEKFLCFLTLSDRAFVSSPRCIGLFLLWSLWYHKIQMLLFYVQVCLLFACCLCHCSSKGGFPLSRNFYVRTDVNFNWLYVRKLK